MSASNWTECPRCASRRREEIEADYARLRSSYGKIPEGEWLASRAAVEASARECVEPEFREDYEFYGASLGVVTAAYSGNCVVCGLHVSFKHDVKFWPRDGDQVTVA